MNTLADQELKFLLDSLPGLVWTALPDGRAEYIGSGWLEYTGLALDQAVGVGWTTALHPDDASGTLDRWAEIIAAGSRGEVEARLRRHDGAYRWFSFRVGPVPDADGRVTRWCGINIDIDERVQGEQAALQKINRELVEAQALSHVGSYTADLLKDSYSASDELRTIWEFDAGALISTASILSRIHPDDRAMFEAEYASVFSGASSDLSFRIVTPSGRVRHLHSVSRVLEYVEGGPIVVGIQQDETERVLAAEALRSSEAALRVANSQLLEAQAISHVGSFTVDTLTDDHDWSAEMRRIWEFEADFRISMSDIRSRIHSDDRPGFEAEYARVLEGSDSDFAFRIVTPSGKVKFLRSRARILEHVKGAPLVIGTQQDVTDSVLAAEALKASEFELRRANAELVRAHGHITAAQRLSQTGSFIWDLTADQHHWSEELYRIAEVDPAVTIDMNRVRECIHPDDRSALEAAIGQAVTGSGFDYAGRIVTPRGGIKYFHIVGQQTERVDGHLVFVGALRDVTETKAAEDALNKARVDLAHASRVMALSALTASIAHEVNQPLAGIVANAETCSLMLAAVPPNVEGARTTAHRMIRDGNRAAEVIQRLRALFSNKPPVLEAVQLSEAIAEVLALASTELQAAGVTVRTEFEQGLPPVRGDRVQLQQVVLNLVLNAAEAMGAVEGSRELTVAGARDGDERVCLSVRDVGVGLTADGVENLFEAFHTTKEKGMGVGLAVSRSIIESHQGRLWAEPNEGPGATFSFTVPVQLAPDLQA